MSFGKCLHNQTDMDNKMGLIRHHAIIVTSWQKSKLQEAFETARQLGLTVIGPSEQSINGYQSILICPDGSKEGWPASDMGDELREAFKQWLDQQRYADGSSTLSWCEVAYGNEDNDIPWHSDCIG
jgi:hypothetical protein